ncbi:hypothetical protein ILUMI_08904 [Ignelater luminosus]|uniref:EndoU domain-containing protein n=1 Tax=Ignelater luminosus TaxID=2038154 RepID=A0A8K0D108_IGNLU|nr:hypothetical protein ILUMI_08904 [Ignelater luminosus]
MDVLIKFISGLLIFCVALIVEILCASGSYSSHNNSNAWPGLGTQNTYYVNPSWPNYGQMGATTPWPELGQPRGQSFYNQNTRNTSTQNTPIWVQNGRTWNRVSNQQQSQPVNVPNNPTSSSGSYAVNTGSNTGVQRQQGQNVTNQDEELREFSENLLQRDTNNAARYVTINYQAKTTSRSQVDEAPLPLLGIHNDAYNIPTISKMRLLYNNYILQSNVNEHVSPQEREEENNLLDALLSTSVMQQTRNFLINKGAIGKDPQHFRNILKEIWFNMYSRGGGKIGSSGFEHVFLAELKNGAVSGLHNWLYFKEEESKNTANYLGYMKNIDLGNKGAILKYHFKFHDVDKPVGSMFIGTSPEFEIALYTTCFLLRADQVCPLRLSGHNFIIRTFTYRYRGKNLIGSAFPEI